VWKWSAKEIKCQGHDAQRIIKKTLRVNTKVNKVILEFAIKKHIETFSVVFFLKKIISQCKFYRLD